MRRPSERVQRDPEKQPGLAKGKRVWLKDTWDAAVTASRLGDLARDMLISDDKPDSYGRIAVTLANGSEVRVSSGHLRLSVPPSLASKQPKAKETKAPVRKEAIDPEYGEELTIFDAMEASGG